MTILNEGRDAPLYHATKAINALSIIQSDTLQVSTEHELDGRMVKGVSLTRSFEFAKHWRNAEVIFEIDQRKLSQMKRIFPVDFFSDNVPSHARRKGGFAEAEEFVVGKIHPLSKSLKGIHITFKTQRAMEEDIDDFYDFNHILNHELLIVHGGHITDPANPFDIRKRFVRNA